ncbi:MAG: Smr/MutS family protein [Hyphomicrobium sp.]|jgi:DNA-nicking Smr family endonuclease
MADDRQGRPLKKPGKRGHDLSAEERALWEHAARTLKPIKRKGRVHAAQETDAPTAPPRAHAHEKAEKAPVHRASAAAPRVPARAAPLPPPPAAPPLSDLDRRKARKIGTGKVEIDGRIDLHGMRQAEAHAALRRFLTRAYAEGRRWLLVITGKGAPLRRGEDDEGPVGVRDHERGVLKRNVPRWLAEPELRSIVVGFTTAAIRHGGEGALYVQLRRHDRPD